jgi:uroporphyrinogen decarboxylase
MNDIFLKACKGEKTRPVPVWIMRQAGRYLPDYQKVRGTVDFLTLCKTPELAAEVTLQPVNVLGVDAAILFSDILIPLEPMGIQLAFSEGKGPILTPAIRTAEQIKNLKGITPEQDVPFVLETIRILRKELAFKCPLIGFGGAPFTLATYLIEGGSSRNFLNTKRMMFQTPELFHELMSRLTEVTTAYLSAQIQAGAQVIQLFDTWGGILSTTDYENLVLPYVKRTLDALSGLVTPTIYFVYDGSHLLHLLKDINANVIGLDWRTDISQAVASLGSAKSIQGNLDPCALLLPEQQLRERVKAILKAGQAARSHIFNLGHGILPEIPWEKAKMLVDMVHELSS